MLFYVYHRLNGKLSNYKFIDRQTALLTLTNVRKLKNQIKRNCVNISTGQ